MSRLKTWRNIADTLVQHRRRGNTSAAMSVGCDCIVLVFNQQEASRLSKEARKGVVVKSLQSSHPLIGQTLPAILDISAAGWALHGAVVAGETLEYELNDAMARVRKMEEAVQGYELDVDRLQRRIAELQSELDKTP